MMIIITGKTQSGKSSLATELFLWLKKEQIRVAGIIAPGLWKNNLREGFNLIDLSSGCSTPLARRKKALDKNGITPFEFFEAGLNAGKKALDTKTCSKAEIVIVDEIGRLEIRDQGWASLLNPLLALKPAKHIWIVRENLVKRVCDKWALDQPDLVSTNEKKPLERLKKLCSEEK